jgi:phosphohistidine phosphatase
MVFIMKRLYLVRHAKSSWKDLSLPDFDRPLNKRGKRDAPLMGEKLKKLDVLPDLLIASPAKRAKKTAKTIAAKIGYKSNKIIFDESIYHLGITGIVRILSKLDSEIESVMLVGHNPDLTILAEQFSGNIVDNVPTCGIFCLEFNFADWRKISSETGRTIFFEYPKKDLME